MVAGALALSACASPASQQAESVAEAMRGASSEVDAVVVRDANHGFVPVKIYDVYVPELDDDNLVDIVDALLAAAEPAVVADDPLEPILYSTTYSEDPIVRIGPFNSEPGVLAQLGLDSDGDGSSDDREGFITVDPVDLHRVYPAEVRRSADA